MTLPINLFGLPGNPRPQTPGLPINTFGIPENPREQPKYDTSFLEPEIITEPVNYYSDRKPPKQDEIADFVLDFVQKNGRAPYEVEINDWKDTFKPQATDQYKPGSIMYEMGFRTVQEYGDAQSKGETYGPHSGGRVPEGSIIVTDEQGNPLFRTYDLEQYKWALDSGRYIDPKTDTKGEYYPQYSRDVQLPDNPNDIMGAVYSPTAIYGAKITDYYSNLKYGVEDKYEKLIQQAMGNAEAQQELQTAYENEVNELINQENNYYKQLSAGTPPDQLDIYAQLADVMGENTNQILNRALQELTGREEKRISKIPEFRGYKRGETQPAKPTGNELQEYLSWVNGRTDIATEFKRYLQNRFSELYQKWVASKDSRPFLAWVKTQV
jgi:hypothetical protein